MPPKKKNAFIMFVDQRRFQDKSSGVGCEEGLRKNVERYHSEWEALSEAQKRRFHDAADAYNAREKPRRIENPVIVSKPNPPTVEQVKACRANMYWEKALESRDKIAALLDSNPDWMRQPVVVASFSLRVEPGYGLVYIPAEIGLSAMSLEDGVVANFARIIDPGEIPKGYGIEAAQVVKKLGLPELGSVPEFCDIPRVARTVNAFLDTYRWTSEKDMYLFAFESDFHIVEACLDWIASQTSKSSCHRLRPIRLMSLDYYLFSVGSRCPEYVHASAFGSDFDRKITNSRRRYGKPMSGNFIYPNNFPSVKYGWFSALHQVEEVIKDIDNFKYCEELCCAYHMKTGNEYHRCALSEVNRYVFSALEILTFAFDIAIHPGKHYPELEKPEIEKRRRLEMLQQWDMTDHELHMEFQTVREEPEEDRGRDKFQRRWEQRQREIAETAQEGERARTAISRFRTGLRQIGAPAEVDEEQPIPMGSRIKGRSFEGRGRSRMEENE